MTAKLSATKTRWPAESVELRSISGLIPYANNPRTHSPEQIAQLAGSIGEWGWTVPVLIDSGGGVIAGHGRILAARQLGIEQIPCMIANGWTDSQKRAYVIADNKLAMNAQWDELLLSDEMIAISSIDFDVSLIGFSDDEVAALCDKTEKLQERREQIKPKTMMRVLISVPVDSAIDVKDLVDQIADVPGVEVDYSGN